VHNEEVSHKYAEHQIDDGIEDDREMHNVEPQPAAIK